MPLKLPSDFAKEIAKSLGMTAPWVDEWFDVEETKDGYFVAKLKPKKFLEKDQFRTMCALARDLGGEGYLEGMKAWKVPGPLVKKPLPTSNITSTPSPMDARSKPQPASTVAPDSLTYDKSKPPEIPNIKFIPIDAVKIPNFLPTRTLINHERLNEITNSIKKHGLKYPIKVRRANSDYELIDGYLRLRSVQQLGWKGILAEIKEASDKEVLTESIIVNKNRIEEDPITVAKKLDILINAFGYTQEKLGEELGLDQSTISHYLRLLKLPKEVQKYVALHITFYHALLLLTLHDSQLQVQLAKEVVDSGLSTRQLEERIRELQPKPVAPSPPEPSAPSQPSEPSTEARRTVQPESSPSEVIPAEDEDFEEEEEETPEPEPKPKAEAIDIGGFECPECGQQFIVEHVAPNLHRLRVVKKIES